MENTAIGQLFERHYPDGEAALTRFRAHLAQAKLEFDVEGSISEHRFPDQTGQPSVIPSFVFYYVPSTRFGSVRVIEEPATESAHLQTSDGIGLNMGCPIRLARALNVVFSLTPADQAEPLFLLRSRACHLACVEELLWLTLWKDPKEITRGGELIQRKGEAQAKNVDWRFFTCGTPIFLEAKFRPTDWMRFVDQGIRQTTESLFDDIGAKFPREKSALRKCVAAVTGYAEPDNAFFALAEKKLINNPGLDAILFRTLLGPIYICSLVPAVVQLLVPCIKFYEPGDYPWSYPVDFNRQLRENRQTSKPAKLLREKGHVYYTIVPTNRPGPVFRMQFPYRSKLAGRTGKGQPIFEHVPPFLDSASLGKAQNRPDEVE
jgi:hypothetical protein